MSRASTPDSNVFEYNSAVYQTSDNWTYNSWTTTSGWWIFSTKTYHYEGIETSGYSEFNTYSLKADDPVAIQFIGSDTGTVSITSDAALILDGSINNPAGTTTLSSGGTLEQIDSNGVITTGSLTMSAQTGIGDKGTITTALNGGTLQAVNSVSGGIDIQDIGGSSGTVTLQQVTTPDGNVTLSTLGSVVAQNTSSLVQGNTVTLSSQTGGIGTSTSLLPIDVASGDALHDGLTATAAGSSGINLEQTTGDLLVDSVDAAGGDVHIKVDDGNILNNNKQITVDPRSAAQLLSLWNSMSLTTSDNTAVNDYLAAQKQGYTTYWTYRVLQPNGGTTYDPTATIIDANGNDVTDLYHHLNDLYGQYGNAYNPSWVYPISEQEEQTLLAGSTWTQSELTTSLPAGIIETSQTQVTTQAPNITGRNVYLTVPSGNIGANLPPVTVTIATAAMETFDPSTAISGNVITFASPDAFTAGMPVAYNSGTATEDGASVTANSIGGLVNGMIYYVVAVSPSSIELSTTSDGSNVVALNTTGTTGTAHTLMAVANPFNPATAVNNTNNTISFSQPDGFTNGEQVVYSSGAVLTTESGQTVAEPGDPIGGLINGMTYYVVVVNSTTIKLSTTSDGANVVQLDSTQATGSVHSIRAVVQFTTSEELAMASANPSDLSFSTTTNPNHTVNTILTISQQKGVELTDPGILTATASGDIYVGSAGGLNLDGIISTGNQPIQIEVSGDLTNAESGGTAAVTGGDLTLESANGGIGENTSAYPTVTVKAMIIDLAATATITVRAYYDIYLTEQASDANPFNVDFIVTDSSQNGRVTLVSNGSILNAASLAGQENIGAGSLDLQTAGSVGTSSLSLVTHLWDATQEMDVSAGTGVYINQDQGNMNAGTVTSTTGDISLVAGGGDMDVQNVTADSGDVTLEAFVDIFDATAPGNTTANVTGNNIDLTADNNEIGAPGDDFKIQTSHAAPGHLTASSASDIYLIQRSGSLAVNTISAGVDDFGSVFLDLLAGGITNAATAGQKNVTAYGLALSLAGGNVGTVGTPFLTEVTKLAGIIHGSGWITNTGPLYVDTVVSVDGLTAVGGGLSVTADCPISLNQPVSSGGSITMAAYEEPGDADGSDSFTMNGYSVTSTDGNVTLEAGDSFFGDSASLVSAVNGTVTIIAADSAIGAASDEPVTLDDMGSITAERVYLDTNVADDTINISNVSSQTQVNTGAGSVTVNLGSNAGQSSGNVNGNLEGFTAPLTIDGGTGGATVNVDDSGQTTGQSGTLTNSKLSGLDIPAAAGIAYSGVSALNIALGVGSDTLAVDSLGAPTSVNGGDGSNVLDLSGYSTGLTFDVTGHNAGSVTAADGTITFESIQGLKGGAGNDAFVFASGTSVDGNINGEGGYNALNWSAYTTPVSVNVQSFTATGIGGTFANIEQVIGGSSDSSTNTLTGQNVASAWNITANDAGNISEAGDDVLDFGNFGSLTGGTQNDTFIFANGKTVSGNVNGGDGGYNTLNWSAYTTPVSANLQSATATGIGGTFANIEQVIGGPSDSSANTLTGQNAASTWNITSNDAGNVSEAGSDVLDFTNFGNLTGGTQDDAFVFANGKGVNGNINGGGGYNTLNWSAYTTSVSVNIQSATATGIGGTFANIEQVIGGSSDSVSNTLIGQNVASAWNITSNDAGNISESGSDVLDFTNFGNLTGGTQNDTFVFTNGKTVSGNINGGGGGYNTLNWSAYTTPVSVNLQTPRPPASAARLPI